MEDYASTQVLRVVFLVGLLARLSPILKLNSTLTRLDTTLIRYRTISNAEKETTQR